MIIGLTGGMASGKLSIAKFLEEKGFISYVFSNVINDELRKRNIPITRESQQNIGNEIRNKEGAGGIARRLIVKMEPGKNYIVDGIRNPGEINELKKEKDFFLIAIDAPQKLRFERIINRNMERDPKNWEDFLKADSRDFDDSNVNGLQIGKCMDLADYKIINDGSFEEFKAKILEALREINSGV